MLQDYFEQMSKQLPQYNEEQQIQILDSIRALIMNPRTITYGRPQEDILSGLKEAIEDGGRAATFFTTAYCNWYRTKPSGGTAHLYNYGSLDLKNRHLFIEMIGLRDSGHFDDESLFQFEQYCLDKIENK